MKKKGGRYTPPKKQFKPCRLRSGHFGKPTECKYTSRERTKPKGSDTWGPWIATCSWCGRRKP